MIILACSGAISLDIPAVYRCSAVRVTQVKNGTTYSKGFLVQSLFIKIDGNEVRVFGMHSKMYVCKKLGIRSFFADTIFLEDPGVSVRHSVPKLYMVKDTLMGNVNLFESDTGEVSIKVLVRKLIRNLPTDLEKQCR